MNRLLSILFCGALAFALAACSTMSENTQKLQLGMSTAQVKDILGGDYSTRASKYAADGQPVVVWEFKDPSTHDTYWAYFKGDRLVQWGTPEAIKGMPELQGLTPAR